jgi:hypothetical protein
LDSECISRCGILAGMRIAGGSIVVARGRSQPLNRLRVASPFEYIYTMNHVRVSRFSECDQSKFATVGGASKVPEIDSSAPGAEPAVAPATTPPGGSWHWVKVNEV